MFSSSSKLPTCSHWDAMLSVYFWYDYVEEWDLWTSFHSTFKQVLRYTRKVCSFNHSTYKRYLRCGSIHITSDRNSSDIVYQTYLWNVQNCQVKVVFQLFWPTDCTIVATILFTAIVLNGQCQSTDCRK